MKAAGTAPFKQRRNDPGARQDLNLDSLVIMLMLGAFLATALAGLVIAGLLRDEPMPSQRVRFMVGNATLDVPIAWLRPGMPRGGGRVGRLDLALPWPENGGPADAGPPSARPSEAAGLGRFVLVSLVPADGGIAPADRPATLYARFMTGDATPHASGLILRRFRPGSPFEGEDLLLSPPDGRAFSARCPSRDAATSWREGCVAELRIAGLDAQLRFSPSRLANWKQLADGAGRAMAAMVR
jgi:hypothetical protein